MRLIFVESEAFTLRWSRRCSDEQLRALQNELLEFPERGDPIPGCGMLRKLRAADPLRGKGKRGGLRIIYMHTPEVHRIDLIAVYSKEEKDDMTTAELKTLCAFARMLRAEALTLGAPRRRPRGAK